MTPVRFGIVGRMQGRRETWRAILIKAFWPEVNGSTRNPFARARLSDDEIAVATCLSKMHSYVEGGPPFYSLSEAAQDQYLSIMLERALVSASAVRATAQPWAVE